MLHAATSDRGSRCVYVKYVYYVYMKLSMYALCIHVLRTLRMYKNCNRITTKTTDFEMKEGPESPRWQLTTSIIRFFSKQDYFRVKVNMYDMCNSLL